MYLIDYRCTLTLIKTLHFFTEPLVTQQTPQMSEEMTFSTALRFVEDMEVPPRTLPSSPTFDLNLRHDGSSSHDRNIPTSNETAVATPKSPRQQIMERILPSPKKTIVKDEDVTPTSTLASGNNEQEAIMIDSDDDDDTTPRTHTETDEDKIKKVNIC